MKSAQWAEGAEASSSGLPCPPRASRPQGHSSRGGSRGSQEPAASLSTPSGQGCPGEELRVTGRGAWTRLSTAVHSGPGGARWAAEGTEATGSGAESAGHCLLSETSEAGSRRPLPSTATPSWPGAPGGSAALGPSGTEFLSSSQSLERSGEGPGLAKHGRLRLMLCTCGLCRGRGTGAGEGAGSSSVSHRRSVSPAPRLGGVFHTVNETAVAGQQQ